MCCARTAALQEVNEKPESMPRWVTCSNSCTKSIQQLYATSVANRHAKGCPQTLPEASKIQPGGALKAKMPPEGVQDHPEGAQERPRGGQGAPKRHARAAKRHPRAPKTRPRAVWKGP